MIITLQDLGWIGFRARACATVGEATALLVRHGQPPASVVELVRTWSGAAIAADELFSAGVARLPLATADAELATFLDAMAPPSDRAWDDELRSAVLLAIRSGEPTLPWVAKKLAMSPRTLQRRLQDQGTSFRAIVDEVRSAEAARLLERGERFRVIAEQLGFSEERAFRRAFRRWRDRSIALARPVLAPGGAGA